MERRKKEYQAREQDAPTNYHPRNKNNDNVQPLQCSTTKFKTQTKSDFSFCPR